MSNLTQTDELFFDRAGLDRDRVERIVADSLDGAPTMASCSWSTASRKGWAGTTAS